MKYRNILDRIFPPKYDFLKQLGTIAQINANSITELHNCLNNSNSQCFKKLEEYSLEIINAKLKLEKDLVEAFSTPIDRRDIYLLTINMDRVFRYILSTSVSMKNFDLQADKIITDMVGHLQGGLNIFLEAVFALKDSAEKSEQMIADMRKAVALVEQLYINGMSKLFVCGDAMRALKFREIYHHIKDASSNLDYSVDTLHKIIVGLT